MLEFENQIFLDAFHDDGLLIMSRGLGITRIFSEFLRIYSDPASLVLVLNTTCDDEKFFMDQLEKQGVAKMPKVITNEINAAERQKTYLEGGVYFITSRILVVDLLSDRVPLDHVSGVLVYKAHKIIESCQEAFILRLFRQKNKSGFIKAFTDNADAFTRGFCQVERMMKNLFVKKLFLWPRFQASVVSCFNQHKVDVVEVHQQMSPAMTACQTALLDLINACIVELKKSNSSIDMDEITVENSLSSAFDLIIRLQLEPLWNQLSGRTRQLVSDLKTLRLILRHLTQYDCVTFYSLVQSIKCSERTFGKNVGWLFLDSADKLFVHAKERVYGSSKFRKGQAGQKKNKEEIEEELEDESDDEETTTSLEPCPKWLSLSEVLSEIAEDEDSLCEVGLDDRGVPDVGYRVLVCAEDDRTCSQLKEFLSDGAEGLTNRLFRKYIFLKKGRKAAAQLSKVSKEDGKLKDKTIKAEFEKDVFTLTQMIRESNEENFKENENAPLALASKDAYFSIITAPITVIHPLHGCSDPYGLARTLEEVQPKYVVMYDADMSLIRQLEVYKASRPGKPLRVYFMMYKGSVEEQRYLTTLRREKDAFEYLIREKATMVVSDDQDGRGEDDPNLKRDAGLKTAPSNRQGGASVNIDSQKVIVDMREFRSELPSLIHKRGIDIEPVTIDVGDYILTPDICVERKSVSDLIGSLNNGRLYSQALNMSRYYKRPMLLIEFDASKPFALQIKERDNVNEHDVTSKLAMLTMHFPKLRILWTPSPYASAQLFEELKHGRRQPTVEQALSVSGGGSDMPEWNDRYNHGPQDFVLRLPGITSKNFHSILNKFTDLREVCQASLETLSLALGSQANAETLYNFFHKEHNANSEAKKEAGTKGKGKMNKWHGKKGFKRK